MEQLANHLLAELDQLSMTDKRPGQGSAAPQGEQPKIKSLELEKADKGKGKGKEKTGEEEKGKMKCRFYNSEGGCKKGKECEWLHESRDDKRRCWTCGAVDHMSPACSRPKGSGGGSPQNYNKQKLMKSEAEEKSGGQKESSDTQSVSSEGSIKELLEEAGKMLKSVTGEGSAMSSNSTSGGGDQRKDLMDRLQQQLKALRTFKLQQLSYGEHVGLVDSGATNALRPIRQGEDCSTYPEVDVSLANGKSVKLKMSPGGSMLAPDMETEPIVPMGQLAEVLHCDIQWKGGSITIIHPEKGVLPIEMRGKLSTCFKEGGVGVDRRAGG